MWRRKSPRSGLARSRRFHALNGCAAAPHAVPSRNLAPAMPRVSPSTTAGSMAPLMSSDGVSRAFQRVVFSNCFSASASSGLTEGLLQRGSVRCRALIMAGPESESSRDPFRIPNPTADEPGCDSWGSRPSYWPLRSSPLVEFLLRPLRRRARKTPSHASRR
jgi:hypothetical protein